MSSATLPTSADRPLRLALIGAAPDTGNLGVSALCESVIHTIARLEPDAQVTFFDNGRGNGEATIADCPVRRQGLRYSRRIHQPSSLLNARLSMATGGIFDNPILQVLRNADVALDITGGDSFSDIYGPERFRRGVAVKQLVLRCGTPLILLPQTYGPYQAPAHRREAADLVQHASMAWARDGDSFEVLRELGGDGSVELRCGVDVAVQLPALDPGPKLDDRIRQWIDSRGDGDPPLVGLNVSGLLFNDPEASARQYGLTIDYPALIRRLVERLLQETNARIVLTPHVGGGDDTGESDVAACRTLARALNAGSRVAIGPSRPAASEVKWIISQCDWFCGTRMHSTIAALSTGTPASAIAYSLKTRGVFETFGLAQQVADARSENTDEILATLWHDFEGRNELRRTLSRTAPRVRETALQQMRDILDRCRQLANAEVKAPAKAPLQEAQPA